jgi:hypothetical protein
MTDEGGSVMLDKNIIKKAVRNKELLRALNEMERVKEIAVRLHDEIIAMEEFGIAKDALYAAQAKFAEYAKIRAGYETMLENTFCVTWHYWDVILKYRSASYDVIEKTSIEALSRG